MNCAECLPLKIGDIGYIIRRNKAGLCIRRGAVSEIKITRQHRPLFAIHYVGRGYYGDTVFGTPEEAAAKLEELRGKENYADTENS